MDQGKSHSLPSKHTANADTGRDTDILSNLGFDMYCNRNGDVITACRSLVLNLKSTFQPFTISCLKFARLKNYDLIKIDERIASRLHDKLAIPAWLGTQGNWT